ncbi:hypothetical protein [Caldisericum sp.]|uniref:hypothetical protein n=1 Tax=Caldisericum sp. TaxID=2499687 RepID=UPI003D0B5704
MKHVISFIVLGIFLGLAFVSIIRDCVPEQRAYKVQKDTFFLIKQIPPETLIKTEIKTIVQKRKDTVYINVKSEDTIYVEKIDFDIEAFDTLITKKDTIEISYTFPENKFSYNIKYKPDSIQVNTVYIPKKDTSVSTLWDKLYYGGLGFIGGFIIGAIIK